MTVSPDERLQHMLTPWSAAALVEGALRGGYRNRVWAVRIAGRRYAARLSVRPAPALDWELDLLTHLRASGMHVPLVLPSRDGRTHVDGLALFSWLEGDPPTTEHDWRLVAEELQRLHALTRDWPQRPTFHSSLELLSASRGGDVRLDLMPPDVVQRVRDAWRALQGEPMSIVHGDAGAANIRIARGRVGLIDWDEARVDVSLLDLAALPEFGDTTAVPRHALARRAAVAWEVANGWVAEPEYARRRLAELDTMFVPFEPERLGDQDV